MEHITSVLDRVWKKILKAREEYLKNNPQEDDRNEKLDKS